NRERNIDAKRPRGQRAARGMAGLPANVERTGAHFFEGGFAAHHADTRRSRIPRWFDELFRSDDASGSAFPIPQRASHASESSAAQRYSGNALRGGAKLCGVAIPCWSSDPPCSTCMACAAQASRKE